MGTRYSCLIVDDEMPAHLVLKSHISKCDDLFFADSAFNGKEALRLLLEKKYDLVFLDIDMPVINGMELMQTLSRRPATIITTAYDKFAFEAYQQDAVDYLLKPVSLPRFLKAIEKTRHFLKSTDNQTESEKALVLRIDGENKVILPDEISYLQSIGNYVKVFFKQRENPIVVYDTLKNLLEKTPGDLFIQTHKSFIVNAGFIASIGKNAILLKDQTEIPLGRKYELLVSRKKSG